MIACKYEDRLYYNPSNGYTVAVYSTEEAEKVQEEAVRSSFGGTVQFTVVGMELPCLEHVEIEMEGKWEKSQKFGYQMKADWFRVTLPKSREGIIGYLSSGLVKGIGPVMANEIVKRFGTDTFQVFDSDPERLLVIKGITEPKLEEIMKSYHDSAEIRELMAYLAPYKVTPKKAEKIKEHFGLEAVRIVKENPYRLCEIKGFGFLTVDPIARSSRGFCPDDPFRIKAALQYVLKEAEKEGHLYLDRKKIMNQAERLLNKGFGPGTVGRNRVIISGNELVLKDKILEADGNAIYLKENRKAEQEAAYHLIRLMKEQGKSYDIEEELAEAQAECGLVLAEKQKEAVRMVFKSPVSIITGGPGKGKTTVLKIILQIFEKLEKNQSILLCAPTGRARKRLSESTGYPALTIHKALYLTGEEEEDQEGGDCLEEDFVIADEFTMSDMKLSSLLFSRIESGARLVLVGDVDQLPSVGPGNVFKELIESGVIPVTVLDVFFRQAKDSRIVLNADLINKGKHNLVFGEDFRFVPVETPEEAADKIEQIYKTELEAHKNSPDEVQVLSPLRVNTQAGVIALNKRLRETANPFAMEKSEWKTGSVLFRLGDKVMQTKNTEEISNGDIGVASEIGYSQSGDRQMTVNFGELQRNYSEEDLSILEHAYAISVHKSQGGEYPVVILPVLTCFFPMLKRNVYYTAITRAKNKVYLVGSKKALNIAIASSDVGKRNTMLAWRIQQEAKLVGYHTKKEAA